jgi:hypothetical protein
VSAIGRLIRYQHSNINLPLLLQIWIANMPLRYDLEEANINYALLVEILEERREMLIPHFAGKV